MLYSSRKHFILLTIIIQNVKEQKLINFCFLLKLCSPNVEKTCSFKKLNGRNENKN